jgi:hypothetical protein
MPGFSTFKLDIGNNPLQLTDLISYNSKLDSLIWFLNPNATKEQRDKVYNKLNPSNNIFYNAQIDLLSFGFKISSWYFTYALSVKSDFEFTYPKDLGKLLIYGLDTAEQFNFTNLGINSMNYAEMAFGASKKINDDLAIGGKIKIISGLADINTSNQSLQLNSSVVGPQRMFQLDLISNTKINASLPLSEMPKNGTFSMDSIKNSKFNNDVALDYLKHPFSNRGIGIDLGLSYSGIDKLVLSASMVDLGFINWKKNAFSLTANGTFSYTGTTFDFFNDSLNIMKKMTDSLKNQYKFNKSSSSYYTSLPTKIYVGAEYYPVSFLSFGVLSLTELYNSQIYQQVMFSANLKPMQMLEFSMSYSIFNNGFANLGFGMNHRVGPLDFYFVADNIPLFYATYKSVPMIPSQSQSFIMRMGINFVFGCSQKKKLKDKPMLTD